MALVFRLVKNLLFYHNFSPKYVLFVRSFKHKSMMSLFLNQSIFYDDYKSLKLKICDT